MNKISKEMEIFESDYFRSIDTFVKMINNATDNRTRDKSKVKIEKEKKNTCKTKLVYKNRHGLGSGLSTKGMYFVGF